MAPKPGNLNPDSKAGNARLGVGRGSNAGRSQPIPKGSLPAPKKFTAPAGIKVRPAGWVDYVDPAAKFPVHGKTSFTLNRGGRWQGNKIPDRPLSEYTKQVPLKVTNTRTGTSAIFGNSTKEDAVKRFLESEPVYAKLTQGFSAAIKKAK